MSLSRRDLFACSAAAVLAGRALPAAAATTIGTLPRRGFKKAVKWYMVGAGHTVLEKFALLKKLGFDGVELDSPSDLKRDEVLAAKQQTGLEIPGVVDSVHWEKPFSDPGEPVRAAGRKALEQALRDCKAYGGTSVLLVPAVIKKDVPYADAWERSQKEIRALLPLAAELQVMILIENVWNGFLLGPFEMVRYVDELQSPWVGCHFDAGNLVRFCWPEHWVPILGKRIKKIDVKDFVRDRKGFEGFDVKLNDGEADWPSITKALKAVGYDGWFCAEMATGDEQYLADLARRMDSFLEP